MITESYKTIIKAKTKWSDINLKELWAYRDLIILFVKRNFMTRYKQTVLGSAWLIIVPIVNTFISTFVFGTIAEIPSDGVPYFIFYMCGNSLAWTFFVGCFSNTSATFTGNSAIFGKVYFPRLVAPIASVLTGFLDFLIHLAMFLCFWVYFFFNGAGIKMTWAISIVPLLLIQMALFGLGCGIIVSSLTTKYRDLTVLVGFGISLWMYITPIIYSTSSLSPKLRAVCLLNPVAPIIEIFRYAFLGVGDISYLFWGISWIVTLIVLFVGLVIFNKVEKTFMDTV